MSFTGRTETFLKKTLPNNDFLPDVKVGDFQEQHRISSDYSQAVVEDCLYLAMIEINGRLATQQTQWQADGADELDDVPNQPIDEGYSKLYIAAVFHWAKAELIRQFTSVTTRKVSDVTSSQAEPNESWYRKRADQYVRQIIGIPGITCELL